MVQIPLESISKVSEALEHIGDSSFATVQVELHVGDAVEIIQRVQPTFNQLAEELWDCVNHATKENMSQHCVNDQTIKQEEQ